jgi:2-polyprenyl-3-methyl-5-hydroxy-6-metoxy-1,4-benzoquinol methylase
MVACRVCGGSLGVPLLVHDLRDRFEIAVGVTQDGYRRAWRRCGSCGVVQNVQRAEDEQKLDALSAAYYEVDLGNNIRDKFDRVMSMPPASSDNAGRVERIKEFIQRGSVPFSGRRHVMDIGAGLGVFLARFLNEIGEGWVGTAVEPDPNAAVHLRSIGGFNVVEAIFTGQEPDLPEADLVTLNKVVEHLPNPQQLILAAKSKLHPKHGILYVEVPDALTISRRPPTDNILGALHKHLYSPASLALLIKRAGLEVMRIGRVFEPSGKITVFGFARLRAASDGYGNLARGDTDTTTSGNGR